MKRQFTASAFVVDSKKRVLLLWHKKSKKWMPPGGHIDENELPEDAAKRECKEETGIDVEIVGDEQHDLFAANAAEGRILKKPIAFLLEEIEARPTEPAHQHMDFVYRARPIDEAQSLSLDTKEGDDLRWFTKEDVAAIPDGDMYANVREYVVSLIR